MGMAHGTPFDFWRCVACSPPGVSLRVSVLHVCTYAGSLGWDVLHPQGPVLWGAVRRRRALPGAVGTRGHTASQLLPPRPQPGSISGSVWGTRQLAVQFWSESPAPGSAEEDGIACTGGLHSESGDRQRRPRQDGPSAEPITSGGPCVGTFLLTCATAPGAACSATFPSVVPLVPRVCVGAWGGRAPGSRRGCPCPPPASAPSADGCPPPRPPSQGPV